MIYHCGFPIVHMFFSHVPHLSVSGLLPKITAYLGISTDPGSGGAARNGWSRSSARGAICADSAADPCQALWEPAHFGPQNVGRLHFNIPIWKSNVFLFGSESWIFGKRHVFVWYSGLGWKLRVLSTFFGACFFMPAAHGRHFWWEDQLVFGPQVMCLKIRNLKQVLLVESCGITR